MELQTLAQLGEFIGGVAVVITLVYLARQVRQGRLEQRKETYRSFLSELNQVLFSPMNDPQMMTLLQRAASDFEGLSLRDQGVVNSVWSPLFFLLSEVHLSRKAGAVDQALADQLDLIALGFVQMPGTAQWFARVRPFWAPEYLDHLDELLSTPERAPALNVTLPWYFPDQDAQNQESAVVMQNTPPETDA